MKASFLRVLLGSFFLFGTFTVAASVSPYLPVKLNPTFELEIERLVTLTGYPALKKPYHIATIVKYLDQVQDDYPVLHGRINRYIKRFKKPLALTHAEFEIRASDSNSKTLKNSRGYSTDSNMNTEFTGFWQANHYFIANLGGGYSDEQGFIPFGSFVSFGHKYLQVDVGYREHWLSPLQGSSQLVSTQAKPMLGVTLSNVQPLTDWNVMYELGFGQLDTVDGIASNDTISRGKPNLLTMHLSMQLTDWWTLSGNRTMQFGGDSGTVGLSEVWHAAIDSVSSNNCDSASDFQDCDQEFGNQQASVASRMDLNWGATPFSLIVEVAGEVDNDFKAYQLGNKAYSVGLFIPYLSPTESLNLTAQYVEDAWYSHHLYTNGYSNDKHVMGHWWGDEKRVNDSIGAKIFSVAYSKDFESSQLRLEYQTIKNEYSDSAAVSDYQRGHYVQVDYNWQYENHFLGLHLYTGKDLMGETFSSLAFSKQW